MIQSSTNLLRQNRFEIRLIAVISIVCLVSVISHNNMLNSFVSDAYAQTEFEIQTNTPNLEQEYREELDKWMLLAYEGDTEAQFKVGVLYTNDQFNQPDFEQAVYWYKQASRQGHILAQYNLGHQYLTGVGVRKNELTAMQWWLKAAESDHALAQFNIGRAYFLGIGFKKDQALSKYWFERAAYNKEPKSIDILQELGWSEGVVAVKPDKPKVSRSKKTTSEAASISVKQIDTDQMKDGWQSKSDQSVPVFNSRITPITIEPISKTNKITAKKPNSDIKSSKQREVIAKEERKSNISSTVTQISTSEEVLPEKVVTKNDTKQKNDAKSRTNEQSRPSNTQTSQKTKVSIGLFTNPEIRSVLIAITNNREALTVIGTKAEWSIVRSEIGFPVWVHNDFLQINNKSGIITGQNVNARSVPIITSGTIVGSFNQNERTKILAKRGSWYRVIAPHRFKAWAKTVDLKQIEKTNSVPQKRIIVKQDLNRKTQKADVETKSIETKPIEIKQKPPVVEIAIKAKPNSKKPKPNKEEGFSSDENGWLFTQAPEKHTLQLASFDDLNKVKLFLANAKQLKRSKLHKFTAGSKDIKWTYFLYGSFSTVEKAEKAKVKIKQKLAWRRSFGKIQENRCLAWSKQKPMPPEFKEYCSL